MGALFPEAGKDVTGEDTAWWQFTPVLWVHTIVGLLAHGQEVCLLGFTDSTST